MVITYDSEGTRVPGTWRPGSTADVLVVCPACGVRTLVVSTSDINGERTELQCKCGLNETASLVAFKVPDVPEVEDREAKDRENQRAAGMVSDIGEPRTGGEIADELDPDCVRSGDELPGDEDDKPPGPPSPPRRPWRAVG